MSLPGYRLVVFDWDGTLMDSEARIVACLRAAIADVGLPPRPAEALRGIIGLGLQEALHALYPDADAAARQALVERYRYHFLVENTTPTALFEGVPALLAALEARGHLLAVATGKGRAGLNAVLEETGLAQRFHCTRCADETRSKPHPQMLEQIMDATGSMPRETLMVGDTAFDLEMARHAGADALGVAWGVHGAERLRAQGPLAVVDSVAALHRWLLGADQAPRASA